MPARRVNDNRIFDRLGFEDLDNGPLALLVGINDARLEYLRQVLGGELGEDLQGVTLLDIGCGIGLLTEPLARLGCAVTGVDPSLPALDLARVRAAQAGLEIDYRQGRGEALPWADASFEVVICCDVLEHVDDLPAVLGEVSRVLAPGGVFLFSTLNRTLLSWLLAIKGLQDWPLTRLVPPELHDWRRFIRPGELASLMAARNLTLRDITGLQPAVSPLHLYRNLRACKRGEITVREFGRRLAMRPSRSLRVQYLGYALRA